MVSCHSFNQSSIGRGMQMQIQMTASMLVKLSFDSLSKARLALVMTM